MNAETIVKVEGLTKKYDTKAVVDNLSFEIKEGEIFWFTRSERSRKIYNDEYALFTHKTESGHNQNVWA